MTLLVLASQMLPPGPTSFPRRDVFWLGALGIVLLLAGILMVVLVHRLREAVSDDETLEGP